jgi:sugar lactone lactonase YvrE
MSVSISDQSPTVTAVAHPAAGYKLTGYAVSADGNDIALVEEACDPQATSPQGRIVAFDQQTQQQHAIAFPSYPPAPIADPSWEPDGRHIDVFVRTGMQGELARYDAFAANSWSDSTPACQGFDEAGGLPQAVRVDGAGTLWIAAQTGTAMQVTRCAAGKPTVAFSVPGNGTPTDLAVTGNGSHVLLTDANGGVWRWDGNGAASRISGLTLPAATW